MRRKIKKESFSAKNILLKSFWILAMASLWNISKIFKTSEAFRVSKQKTRNRISVSYFTCLSSKIFGNHLIIEKISIDTLLDTNSVLLATLVSYNALTVFENTNSFPKAQRRYSKIFFACRHLYYRKSKSFRAFGNQGIILTKRFKCI